MEILFSHIYIYLYIICENDTSKSYFHIYTFSFLEELHPSLDSFHTQTDSWPRRPKEGGQRARRAGNSEVQQQNALRGWKSYQSLVSASQWFVFIGLQILLGVSLLAWLLVSHAGYPFKISSSCHWSLIRKRKSCELKWSWSASRLGKKSSAILLFWNSSLIAFSLCVSSFLWGKGKKPPDFETVCLQHLVNFNKKKVNGGSISNLSPKRTVFHHLKS